MKLELGPSLAIELNPETGELTKIWSLMDSTWIESEISCSVSLLVGGEEERGPTGGLTYPKALEVVGSQLLSRPTEHQSESPVWEISTSLGQWNLIWTWRADSEQGALHLELAVGPSRDKLPPVRSVTVTTDAALTERMRWKLEAPGNQLRGSVLIENLPPKIGISPATGSRGSSAVISLHKDDGLNILLWPLCLTEPAEISLSPNVKGVSVVQSIGMAGAIPPGQFLKTKALVLDVKKREWDKTKQDLRSMYFSLGITTPDSRPRWIEGATILEAQLGFAPFWGGHSYEPYANISDLKKDLPRLIELGFDCIQLMPRQPYPSYNIHDLFDIETTYAPEDELREFVRECHSSGVRVILDILMHGVIDRAAVAQAANGVRTGPLFGRLNEDPGDLWAADPNDWTPFQIAWSRHVLDFERYWMAGSPERAEFLDSHPDWFFRNSSGAVTGVYTHALDVRNPGFSNYFVEAALNLVKRLGIDGFRFDAPTYNHFPNWSKETRAHASASVLACNELFARLRIELKQINPDILLYTEPSGIALRKHMDVNYNYDEAWLPSALLNPSSERRDWTVVTAHDFVVWLRDRDELLPAGSLTAHHLDSHDTFWWPNWEKKWRREQFGIAPSIALTSAFILSGGPFMMFIGGELGMEEELRNLKQLRQSHATLVSGTSEFKILASGADSIFSVIRMHRNERTVVLVNLSDQDLTAEIEFPEGSNEWLGVTSTSLHTNGSVNFTPWSTRVFSSRN